MPFLIPLLFGGAAFMGGAFFGSQVDDSIDQPPQGVPATQALDPQRILYYGFLAVGLYWLANKSGILKALN